MKIPSIFTCSNQIAMFQLLQESILLEKKLFDQKIEVQRLEDDLKLESDSLIQAKHQLKQKYVAKWNVEFLFGETA